MPDSPTTPLTVAPDCASPSQCAAILAEGGNYVCSKCQRHKHIVASFDTHSRSSSGRSGPPSRVDLADVILKYEREDGKPPIMEVEWAYGMADAILKLLASRSSSGGTDV